MLSSKGVPMHLEGSESEHFTNLSMIINFELIIFYYFITYYFPNVLNLLLVHYLKFKINSCKEL